MTVKTQLVVSLLITVTAIVFAGHSTRPEPLKSIGPSRAVVSFDRTDAAIAGTRADRHAAGLKGRVLAPVASVTSRLDLTKLTLADFGDAE